ncbi:MAG: hypothetical protein QM813_03090 [Verrucomicrobiota bacterium]
MKIDTWNKCWRYAIASVVSVLALAAQAQVPATLTDFGATPPTPGVDDISQLTTPAGPNNPDGLNYYFDNGTPPGQTFTTGSNPNGYVLNSLYVATAGNSGGSLPVAGQAYVLRIYSVSGSAATLLVTYQSQNGFLFTETDWLQWTGLNFGLQPNTQYAYSFRRVTGGWENMANVAGNLYAGGEVVLIPTAGGNMTLGASHDFDASFSVGLSVPSAILVNTPLIAPQAAVTAGTAVTISTAPAVGPGPLYYQWQTDGGSGGTLTNIPAATSSALSVTTTGMIPGSYRYAVVVTNSTSSVTSSVQTLAIYRVGPATLSDVTSVLPGGLDITQLVGGGDRDGLNYYTDNANAPGQTFTTGANAQGYSLRAISIGTGGGTANGTTTPQGYNLYIYSISGNNATLLANFTNTTSFSFPYGDFMTWDGFDPVTLKPNTTYAYTVRRNTAGWAGLACSPTGNDLLSGGQICLIPAAGGLVTFGTTGTSDAVFNIVAPPIGVPVAPLVSPIAIAPSQIVEVGTAVTLSEVASGGTLHYVWRTDGGSGGALTNIPSSDASNLVFNTTGRSVGAYRYDVIVANTYGSTTSAVTSVTITYTNTTGTLTDIGLADPLPVADDIAQLILGAGNPDGLNYYTDNSMVPGQTFTTGSNPNGYTLTTLAVHMAGGAGGLPAAGQVYQLRIYSISSGAAALYATFSSQPAFTYVSADWLRWSGLNLPLAKDKTYAYTFGRISTGGGWENLGNVAGIGYAGGEVALIAPNGGPITFGNSHDFDATFVVGLAVAGYPNVAPSVLAPASIVYAGSPVTVTAAVSGTGPFTYQWQTDGGNVGILTNIPGATNPTLAVNTTGLDGLTVAYRLVASNGAGSTTNQAAFLTVNPASGPIVRVGFDTAPTTADRFVGGAVTFTAAFDGTLPISYQWQVDKGSGATNIVGQIGTTLVLTNLHVSDSGNYSLHAVNSSGTSDSTAAPLTVFAQPAGPVTVNFQYRSFEGGHDVGVYTNPGIPAMGSGTYWNQVFGTVNASTSPTYAEDGVTASGFGLAITKNGSWCYTSTPTIPLLDNAAEARGTGSQSFTFTLPNGRHNIVLFSCNGNESITASTTSSTKFTINGLTKTTVATTDLSFIEGNNYVVFSNVVVTGGSLTGTYASAPGVSFGNLNGAQVRYLGPVNATPTSLTQQVAGNQLVLSWPADHAGWTLQTQTNALNIGLSSNWVDVPGSGEATQFSVPISGNNGSVFYRLILK